jgi:formylglycine-generating enzyme required for sulfatase activity
MTQPDCKCRPIYLIRLIFAVVCYMLAASSPEVMAAEAPRTEEESIPGTLVKFQVAQIPGGSFTPHSADGKAARVTVAPFWMGKTEVRWDEYDIFAFRLDQTEEQRASGADATSRPSRPYGAPDRGYGHYGYPTLGVAFQAAEMYCRWLSAKTGKKYRLPTEIEWEYACRAGAAEMKPEKLEEHAWFWENADDKAHAVGQKAPNAWGLHDMLGNVGEWCRGTDGKPVVRGGSFEDKAAAVNCATRAYQTPAWQRRDSQIPKSVWWLSDGPFVGFRVVREE